MINPAVLGSCVLMMDVAESVEWVSPSRQQLDTLSWLDPHIPGPTAGWGHGLPRLDLSQSLAQGFVCISYS